SLAGGLGRGARQPHPRGEGAHPRAEPRGPAGALTDAPAPGRSRCRALTGARDLGNPDVLDKGDPKIMKGLAATLAVPLFAGLTLAPVGVQAADQEIPLTLEKNSFDPAEIKVKAGAPFVLVITNKDKSAEEFESKDLKIE